jgi:DNA-binding CsgD family transcriptional regulator
MVTSNTPAQPPRVTAGDRQALPRSLRCRERAGRIAANAATAQPVGRVCPTCVLVGPTDGEQQTEHIGVTIERRVPRMSSAFRRIEQLALTSREKELCRLLARDPARQELAAEMGVGASTVITHLRNIYAKLGVRTRAALIDTLFTE